MLETMRARLRLTRARRASLGLATLLVAVTVWAVACSGTAEGPGAPDAAADSTSMITPSGRDSGAPTMTGEDAALPSEDSGLANVDSSAPPSTSTILLLSPAGATLLVNAPGATTQFTAVLKGTNTPVSATWTVDLPLVGSIDANGLFTASGALGGLVTVSAATASAHGATTLTVTMQVVDNEADAGAGVIAALRDGGSADPAFTWLYPYDQTVFPQGLTSPTLQWGGEAASYTRVHVTSTTLDYEAFFGASTPPQAALSAAAWNTVTLSAAPGDPVKVEATKLSASGVTGPLTESWTIAQGSLKGTVYYDTYDSPLNNGNGAIMSVKPGGSAQILIAGCHVCHTVSANGSMLVAMGANSDPNPDAGYSGNDPYFYKYGASFDLTADASTLHPEDGPEFGFGALSPDGTRLLSCGSLPGNFPPNIPGLGQVGENNGPDGGDRVSRLYDPRDGGLLDASGLAEIGHALMPAFAPNGAEVVFNHYDVGAGHSLAVAGFASATSTFSDVVDVVNTLDAGADAGKDAGAPLYLAWPYFLPDSKTVIYNTVNAGDYATWNDYGFQPDHYGDLFLVDVPTQTTTPLDALNGVSNGAIYLPYGEVEAHLNYEPTALPVAVGGYYWVVFTSRREYGNTITNASDPGHPKDAGPFEYSPATRKKLWVAALDLNVVPGKDPSHPAFYLDGQEALAGNMRGFWALDPCVQNGTSCGSGDQCCSGFCRQTSGSSTPDGGAILSCVPQPVGCSEEYEKCATASDCCAVAAGYQCVNGYCAQP